MSRFAIASLAAALLAACGADGTNTRGQAIAGGTPDTGHPAIGYITASGPVHCTATLIAPNRILAAAHCLSSPAFDFVLGGKRYSVSQMFGYPSYDKANPTHLPESFDVAVLRLKEAVQGVSPIALAVDPPRVGEEITIVGFGRTKDGATDHGVKRSATTTVMRVLSHNFWLGPGSGTPPTLCLGDSGGPTLVMRGGIERVLGVHSATEGDPYPCRGIGFDVRVDVFRAWIDSAATAPAAGPRDHAFGEPCALDAHCAAGRCLGAPHFVCSSPCAGGCPGGEVCVETLCLPGSGGGREVGETCDGPGQCKDGATCLVLGGTQGARCTEFCDGGIPCPTGFRCDDKRFGFAEVCLPDASWSAPTPRDPPPGVALGAACTADADCESALCREAAPGPAGPSRRDSGAGICTQACDAQSPCPGGYACSPLGSRNVCLPAADGCDVAGNTRGHALPLVLLALLLLTWCRRVRTTTALPR